MVADDELLARYKTGERVAGDQLVQRHFARVRRFFLNKAGDATSDLVQQTFLRCLEGSFAGRSSFSTYLLGIARNVLYEHFRSRSRGDAIDFLTSSVEALDPSPSQNAAATEERMRVLSALRSVPLEQQVSLELFYWEGLSLEQIAEIVEIPVGTVKSRLHTARQSLKRALGRELDRELFALDTMS